MPPVIDPERCVGCGTCEECPGDVIYLETIDGQSLARVKYPNECWYCGSCRQDCPVEAITIRFSPDMLVM